MQAMKHADERIHLGRRHQKSKTGESVAPQKRTGVLQKLKKYVLSDIDLYCAYLAGFACVCSVVISRSSIPAHLAGSVEGCEHVLHSLLASLQQPRTHNVIARLPWYFTFVVDIRMVLNWMCNGGVHCVRFICPQIALAFLLY